MERDRGYSNIALEEALRDAGLDERARAFCTALFYGVVERRLSLDAALARFVKRPLHKLDCEVLCILRMGALQLFYLDGVPARAAIDESVRLCAKVRKTSAGGFVNGVLRACQRAGLPLVETREPAARMAQEYSAPTELARLLIGRFGGEAAARILQASLEVPPLTVRVNTLRIRDEALADRLTREGAHVCAAPLPHALELAGTGALEGLAAFREGLFHVQDLASQRAALCLCAAPGMRVLDTCAAPGGKSFTIAQELGGTGEVVACDIHAHKLTLIESGARRLGLINVRPTLRDAAAPGAPGTAFERVLCDVPCSGLGILRRKPEIKYKPLNEFDGLPEIQYKILENSAHYVREGGILVYSTCTLREEENEAVVRRFLAAWPGFSEYPQDRLGGQWYKTFLPGEDGGDGFFIASLTRRAGGG